MRKRICATVLCALLLLTTASCDKKEYPADGEVMPQSTIQLSGCKLPSQKDFLLLVCDNCDIVKCMGCTGFNGLEFQLISSEPLVEEDMQIALGENLQCDFSISETPMEFPYYVFQAYQGQSWAELYQLSLLQDDVEGEKKFQEERDKYVAAYQQMEETDGQKLYTYRLTIPLSSEQMNPPAEFHTLTLTAGGQTQNYEIGKIQMIESYSIPERDGNLVEATLACIDMPAPPSPDGEIPIYELQFDVQEDLEIVEVSFLGENAPTIKELTLSSAETGVDALWDQSQPFAVSKGDTITLRGSACAPTLARRTSGSLRRYLKVEYVCNGKPACTVLELDYRMRLNSYEAYAALVDGVDMQSYYTDYYFKTLGE